MLKYNEFAESFHYSVQQAEALGLKGEALSAKAIEIFQIHCGGLILYIPKANSPSSKTRNKAIISDFTGNNHAELAKNTAYQCN